VIDTPAVELTRAWNEALFGFKLDLQSQHRSGGTIRKRLCSSTIMARHAVGDGLDPGDVTDPWLARYMSEQYSRRKRGGPCSLYADLRAFWTWFSMEFGTENPIAKIRRPREVMTDVPVLTDEQLTALMAATSGADDESIRNRAEVLVLLDSGLRRMEVAALNCGDVDLV
jgi:site-specific recombinase XerD